MCVWVCGEVILPSHYESVTSHSYKFQGAILELEPLPLLVAPHLSKTRHAHRIRRQAASIWSTREKLQYATPSSILYPNGLLIACHFTASEEFNELCFRFGIELEEDVMWHTHRQPFLLYTACWRWYCTIRLLNAKQTMKTVSQSAQNSRLIFLPTGRQQDKGHMQWRIRKLMRII